jgi:hypothetical protein
MHICLSKGRTAKNERGTERRNDLGRISPLRIPASSRTWITAHSNIRLTVERSWKLHLELADGGRMTAYAEAIPAPGGSSSNIGPVVGSSARPAQVAAMKAEALSKSPGAAKTPSGWPVSQMAVCG